MKQGLASKTSRREAVYQRESEPGMLRVITDERRRD
jgi:hypothetical protein